MNQNPAFSSPINPIYLEGPVLSLKEAVFLWSWRVSIVLLVVLILVLAWLVAFGNLFRSGSDLGYNLGLAGGLMMLSMLLYPLRKRIRFFDRLGRMESWFRYHMFMGIAGPTLILFHSTFKVGSMNGSVALYSMLLVALSGVIGRFVYRHIHRGLYGKELTLAGAENILNWSQESVGSVFSMRPDIEQRLKEFQAYANARLDSIPQRLWRFMSLRHKGKVLSRQIRHDLKKTMSAEAKKNKWGRGQLRLNFVIAKQQVDDFVMAVIQYAQLGSWTRLFSLWHVAHVPFLYLLLFSGIAHVIAVHLY
jgi:hypothetical protein